LNEAQEGGEQRFRVLGVRGGHNTPRKKLAGPIHQTGSQLRPTDVDG
jgi:hypothetical protein